MELTLKKLKEYKPGIFRGGFYTDDEGQDKKWVAVRGGYHDWCIYVDGFFKTNEQIATMGNKIHDETVIKALVICDNEAFQMYRH